MHQQRGSKTKSVETMTVTVCSITCPNCEAEQEGWLVDPRGREHECDECGQKYRVPDDVGINVS